MTRFEVKMLALSIMVGLLVSSAMAQTSKVDDPFRFALGASAQITDNRDSAPDDEKESNIDYYISPKLIFKNKPGEASMLIFTYNPIFRYRTEPSVVQNEADVYHIAKLDLRKKSSEIQETRFIDEFNYVDDPAVTQGGTQLRRDSSFIYNYLEIGTHKKVQKQNTLDIYGLYSLKRYDEASVADESDEDRYSLNLLYLKQHQRKSALALDLRVGGQGYKDVDGVDRSFMSVVGAAGIEHIQSPSLRIGARLGVQFVDYADNDLGSEVAPMFSLSVVGNTIPSVSFTAALDRSIRGSDVYPFASQEATDLRGELEWALKEKSIVAKASATYHVGTYSSDAYPVAGASGEGDETATILEVGLTYRHPSATEFGLMYRNEDVSADASINAIGRDFSRNATTISVARQF